MKDTFTLINDKNEINEETSRFFKNEFVILMSFLDMDHIVFASYLWCLVFNIQTCASYYTGRKDGRRLKTALKTILTSTINAIEK